MVTLSLHRLIRKTTCPTQADGVFAFPATLTGDVSVLVCLFAMRFSNVSCVRLTFIPFMIVNFLVNLRNVCTQ